ncbi:MAG: alpha/beta hydrolase [Planctomycetota bacterium]
MNRLLTILLLLTQAALSSARPQEPTGELPYEAFDVMIESTAEGVTLAGTVTIPPGEGPFPAAVLITGSGPQNRDEEIAGHKPFLVLADRLTRAGIVVLRYDDRGFGQSTGDFASATTRDFADDAAAAADWLRKHDKTSVVGLIGHSEGGYVAPMIAAEDDGIAFVITLAGPALTGLDVLARQNVDLFLAAGATQDQANAVGKAAREAFQAAVDEAPRDELTELVAALVRRQVGLPDGTAIPPQLQPAIAATVEQATQPWLLGFLQHDPADDIRQTRVPFLALLGEKDLQVSAEQSQPVLEELLSRNDDATIVVVPSVNHLFQPATTGLPNEYGRIDVTFDEATMTQIADWISERFAG